MPVDASGRVRPSSRPESRPGAFAQGSKAEKCGFKRLRRLREATPCDATWLGVCAPSHSTIAFRVKNREKIAQSHQNAKTNQTRVSTIGRPSLFLYGTGR